MEEQKIAEFDKIIERAVEEEDQLLQRDTTLLKAEFLLSLNREEEYLELLKQAIELSVTNSKKAEISMLVLNFLFKKEKFEESEKWLIECVRLNEQGGDWEKRNKLNIYSGLISILKRDFEKASSLLIDSLNTFNASDILEYKDLVVYCLVLGLVTLPRQKFSKKILQNSEVIGVFLENPALSELFTVIDDCRYREFYSSLLRFNDSFIKGDIFLKIHSKRIVKFIRVVLYKQYLQSYRAVRLERMASDFGVGVAFLDNEIASLIASGDLPYQIDRVKNIIEKKSYDMKLIDLRKAIVEGDQLLEKVHQLVKIINTN